MIYKDFRITVTSYVEETHPQYNYLDFKAERDNGQFIEVVFHDIDMRIKTYDELLNIFLRRVDRFYEDLKGK